jgi:hypothetical protein
MALNYGTLELNTLEQLWVMDGVPAHVALKLKANFPRIRKDKPAPFLFPDCPEVRADLDWFLKRYPMTVSAADKAALRRGHLDYELKREAVERILLPDWQPTTPLKLVNGYKAWPYQAQAAEVAQQLGRLILVDPASAGKTLTTLLAVMRKDYLPAAIAVEPHLRTQWRDKGVKKFTDLNCHIVASTSPYNLPKADIYIFGHNTISHWVDIADKGIFRSFAVDECQTFRCGPGPINAPIRKYHAARVFAQHAALKIGVTASLIYNYGSEAYPIIDMFAPGVLGEQGDFHREWCSGRLVHDPDALGTYLREQHVMISRTEEDIGRVLPKPNIVPIEVPYDEAVEAEHLDLARTLALRVLDGKFEVSGQAARELDLLLRRITGIAKARHVAAYVRMLISGGEPVLLVGWHRDVYDIWLKELSEFNPLLYTGSESVKQKDETASGFISGRSPLMILSLRSGAGLDGLEQRCNTLVFGELDWSPGIHNQVVWRLRRAAQKRWPVNVIFCHANGGSDPAIMSTLGVKGDQARGIERPGSGVENVVSDDSRIKTLARMFLERTGTA